MITSPSIQIWRQPRRILPEFSPDGKTLAVGENSGKIRLWNVAAGRMLLTLPGHKGSVNGLAFRPDGRALASCNDTEIRLWRAATDKEVARRSP